MILINRSVICCSHPHLNSQGRHLPHIRWSWIRLVNRNLRPKGSRSVLQLHLIGPENRNARAWQPSNMLDWERKIRDIEVNTSCKIKHDVRFNFLYIYLTGSSTLPRAQTRATDTEARTDKVTAATSSTSLYDNVGSTQTTATQGTNCILITSVRISLIPRSFSYTNPIPSYYCENFLKCREESHFITIYNLMRLVFCCELNVLWIHSLDLFYNQDLISLN